MSHWQLSSFTFVIMMINNWMVSGEKITIKQSSAARHLHACVLACR